MIKSLLANSQDNSEHQITRNHQVISIRRIKRQQNFQKRRVNHAYSHHTQTTVMNPIIVDPRYRDQIQQILNESFQLSQLPQLLHLAASQNIILAMRSAIGLRKLVNIHHYLGGEMVNNGSVRVIVEQARMKDCPQIVLEATWCLTNIVSVQDIDWTAVKTTGILDVLIHIVIEEDVDLGIFEHAVIAISNISVEDRNLRDEVIEAGCINFMIKRVIRDENLPNETLQNTLWALSNICRGGNGAPLPPYYMVQPAVRYICCMLAHASTHIIDSSVLTDCLFVLQHHVSLKNDNLQEAINSGLVPLLVTLCRNNQQERQIIISIRIIGNISAGDEAIIDHLVDQGVIQILAKNITHSKTTIRRETCWVLSNLAADKVQTVQQMLEYPGLFNNVCELFRNDNIDIRKEICFIFANLTRSLTPEHYYRLLVAAGAIEMFSLMLDEEECKVLIAVLTCLSNILAYFSREDESHLDIFMRQFDRCMGVEKIEDLQYNEDDMVYKMASQIIKKYIEVEQAQEIDWTARQYWNKTGQGVQDRQDENQAIIERIRKELASSQQSDH